VSVEWARPLWLALLPAVLLLAAWLGRGGPAVSFPRAGPLAERGNRAARLVVAAPTVLRALCLALIVAALARPRSPGAVVEERTRGVPMMIALDVSSSMLAEDFRPRNRLEVAKQTIARFVADHPDDPIGLVAFAGEALTVVPVTTDHAVLLRSLRDLRIGVLEDGTAIGDGLAIAANRLHRVPGTSKVVILMSDGENNRGAIEPVEAARAAAAFGLEVFTIGVGSQGLVRVPVEVGPGGVRYATTRVGLDEVLLRRIAEIGGGRYFRATNPEGLQRIYERIGQLVKTPLESHRRTLYTEWYPPLLALAALVLALEWLLRGSRWGAVPG
jgi:Ca-activated chloride channel family protein